MVRRGNGISLERSRGKVDASPLARIHNMKLLIRPVVRGGLGDLIYHKDRLIAKAQPYPKQKA
jgi:hypothetical protein